MDFHKLLGLLSERGRSMPALYCRLLSACQTGAMTTLGTILDAQHRGACWLLKGALGDMAGTWPLLELSSALFSESVLDDAMDTWLQALVEEQARQQRMQEQQRQMEERQKLQQQLFQVSRLRSPSCLYPPLLVDYCRQHQRLSAPQLRMWRSAALVVPCFAARRFLCQSDLGSKNALGL